ncbi:MAG: hypothetical protein ACRDKV_10245, partial [Solirubrobacterales bacterium]
GPWSISGSRSPVNPGPTGTADRAPVTTISISDEGQDWSHSTGKAAAANQIAVAQALGEQPIEPPPVPSIRALLDRAREVETPVVYVNDNYGDWNSSASELAEKAMAGRRPELVEPLLPPDDASFVIKARHSVF